jgi:hypothetical protein
MPKSNGKKATAADAEIVMRLYDLRRESEMRKARAWFGNFNPQSYEELQKVSMNWGSQENAWMRQVLTYWENAATLALRGAVNRDLFMDWNGEMIFTFVKMKPFLARARQESRMPEFLGNMEALLNSTPQLKKKLQDMETRLKEWNAMRAKTAKAS